MILPKYNPQERAYIEVARAAHRIASERRTSALIESYCMESGDFHRLYRPAYACARRGIATFDQFMGIAYATKKAWAAVNFLGELDKIAGSPLSPDEMRSLERGQKNLKSIAGWFIRTGSFVEGHIAPMFEHYCSEYDNFIGRIYPDAVSGRFPEKVQGAIEAGRELLSIGGELSMHGIAWAEKHRSDLVRKVINISRVSACIPPLDFHDFKDYSAEPKPVPLEGVIDECLSLADEFYRRTERVSLLSHMRVITNEGFRDTIDAILAGTRALSLFSALDRHAGGRVSPNEEDTLIDLLGKVKRFAESVVEPQCLVMPHNAGQFDQFIVQYEDFVSGGYHSATCSVSSDEIEIENAIEAVGYLLKAAGGVCRRRPFMVCGSAKQPGKKAEGASQAEEEAWIRLQNCVRHNIRRR